MARDTPLYLHLSAATMDTSALLQQSKAELSNLIESSIARARREETTRMTPALNLAQAHYDQHVPPTPAIQALRQRILEVEEKSKRAREELKSLEDQYAGVRVLTTQCREERDRLKALVEANQKPHLEGHGTPFVYSMGRGVLFLFY